MSDVDAIRAQIYAKLGFFPPFFEPALATPDVLNTLWLHTKMAYLDNALPSLFKEKLAALLAQAAGVSYCLFCHSSALHGLGVSGQSIYKLLHQDRLELAQILAQVRQATHLTRHQWPAPDSHQESVLLRACLALFVEEKSADLCQAVRQMVDATSYARLMLFLGFNRSTLSWAKGFPEVDFRRDQRVIDHLGALLASEPRLKDIMGSDAARYAAQKKITDELTAVLDSMSDGFFSVDEDFNIVLANRVFDAITNNPRHDYIGKNFLDVFFSDPKDRQTPLYRAYHQVMKTRQHMRLEAHYAPFSCWFFVNIYPKEGGGLAVFFSDITAQKQAIKETEQHRAKLDKVFETSPAAMAVLRGETLILERINPVCQALLGRRDIVGQPFFAAVPEFAKRAYATAALKVLRTQTPYREDEVEIWVQRDGNEPAQRHYLDVTWTPIQSPEEGIYGVFLHALDVTQRVFARQAIERAEKKLQQTVTDLKAERELRSTFVATLTHDLRTPISAGKLAAQLLDRKLVLDAPSKRVVGRIVSAMDRADRMIRDLLDATRLKAGDGMRLEVGTGDFVSLAQQVADEASTTHGDRFCVEGSDTPIVGQMDPDAVTRMLENLLSNAVKYGKSQSPITTRVQRLRDRVRLAVHNEGHPIAAQDQDKLFDAYNRTKSAQQSGQKGWGIGLALVKGIAEAHGGTVGVISHMQQGTTFFVDLPLDCRRPKEAMSC